MCGDNWFLKEHDVLFLGFNIYGNLIEQLEEARKILNNEELAYDISNILIVAHEPCAIKADSDDVLDFCRELLEILPVGIPISFVSGHTHIMAYAMGPMDSNVFISGAGGASHRECSTDIYAWCNDEDYGFIELNFDEFAKEFQYTFYDSEGKKKSIII